MIRRVLGVGLALLLVGAVAGFVGGRLLRSEPAGTGVAAPVAAVSPAAPTPTPLDVLPDPATAPLGTGLSSHEVTLPKTERGAPLTLSVPDGWLRNQQGESQWTWTVEGNPVDAYSMRVRVIAGSRISVNVARMSRVAALQDALANDDVSDLTIESQTDDTMVATYVSEDHLRVTMERWVALGQDSSAYADVAVTGRITDRAGLLDLLTRTCASLRPE